MESLKKIYQKNFFLIFQISVLPYVNQVAWIRTKTEIDFNSGQSIVAVWRIILKNIPRACLVSAVMQNLSKAQGGGGPTHAATYMSYVSLWSTGTPNLFLVLTLHGSNNLIDSS